MAEPVQVVERGELRAGMGFLAATDQPGPVGPPRQVGVAGELDDFRAVSWGAVRVDGGLRGCNAAMRSRTAASMGNPTENPTLRSHRSARNDIAAAP